MRRKGGYDVWEDEVTEIAAILAALVPSVIKIIEALTAEQYDPEAERQALMDFQRAVYDERVKRLLGK